MEKKTHHITKDLCILTLCFLSFTLYAQQDNIHYWNTQTLLTPWKLQVASDRNSIEYIDLDHDGDLDVLKTTLLDGIPILWIDDDDDMQYGDLEGDTDSDCLLIDKNKDGIFAGPYDLSIDWCDENKDGIAEIQLIVSNGDTIRKNYFDFKTDFMYFIDFGEKDGIQTFVDWRTLMLGCWAHSGHSNFYADYHGNTLFLKMHGSSFRIEDLRFNWENPFIFYDHDGDNLTEMTIRLVDTPIFKNKDREERTDEFDYQFTKKIDWVALSWDLDNDNAPGNEFDLDMTINFRGEGFDYSDQKHVFKSLRGLPEADSFFYDARWRQNTELYYPHQDIAQSLLYQRGKDKYQECWFVFDEDDDCNRWERVELYNPEGDLYKVGVNKGGLDVNQADAIGDRAEWDLDNSGKGSLYIGAFDGRIHLYGAEWGCWRIDQSAYTYQGFGGLYDKWEYYRMSPEPEKFPLIRYTDTDKNGFIDLIEYDLDGDQTFEETVSILALGIDDKASVLDIAGKNYDDMVSLFKGVSEKMWKRAMDAVKTAEKYKLNPNWYRFYMQPRSVHEKYDYGYWLNYYIYKDLLHIALVNKNKELEKKLHKAYYSGSWDALTK